jgi:hypothetical protein
MPSSAAANAMLALGSLTHVQEVHSLALFAGERLIRHPMCVASSRPTRPKYGRKDLPAPSPRSACPNDQSSRFKASSHGRRCQAKEVVAVIRRPPPMLPAEAGMSFLFCLIQINNRIYKIGDRDLRADHRRIAC